MRAALKVIIWLALVVGLLFGIGALFFKTRVARDDTMAPSLMAGDKYLLCYRCDLEKGDAVLCDHPDPARKGVQIIGRVVGMDGDVIEVRRGLLRVNNRDWPLRSDGKLFQWSARNNPGFVYTKQTWEHASLFGRQVPVLYDRPDKNKVTSAADLPNKAPVQVSRGHVFLMGDNRLMDIGWDVNGLPAPGGGCNSSFCYGQIPVTKCHGVVYFVYSATDRGYQATASSRRLSFMP